MTHPINSGEVNASSVASAVAFALSQGLSVERIEAATGLAITRLIVPHGRMPMRVRDALWTELAGLNGNCILSLEIARSTDLAVFDGLADAVRYAPDLRAALRMLVKNCCILGDHIEFGYDETGETGAFFLLHGSTNDGERQAGEAGAVMIVRMLSEAFGAHLRLKDLAFASDATGPNDVYRRTLGVTPTFDRAEEAMIAFSKDILDMRPPKADLERYQATELYFELRRRLVEEPSGPAPLSKLKAAITRRVENGDYTVDGVAHEANMSVRSAQRLAAFHGRTLSNLIDDKRTFKAQRLMANDPDLPIATVAERVGYSDERCFRRAFRRWTDMTPSAYKRLLKRPSSVV